MRTIDQYLAEQPFVQGLDPRYVEVIAGCASNIKFDAGEFIFQEGSPATHFYIVTHGRVTLEIATPTRGAITLQTAIEGDVLGWSWLFAPYKCQFDARAVELTRAIAFDGVCLRGKCEADHDLGYEMMKRFSAIMVDRIQSTRLQLLDVYGAHV